MDNNNNDYQKQVTVNEKTEAHSMTLCQLLKIKGSHLRHITTTLKFQWYVLS